jgi:hypothetical protein
MRVLLCHYSVYICMKYSKTPIVMMIEIDLDETCMYKVQSTNIKLTIMKFQV